MILTKEIEDKIIDDFKSSFRRYGETEVTTTEDSRTVIIQGVGYISFRNHPIFKSKKRLIYLGTTEHEHKWIDMAEFSIVFAKGLLGVEVDGSWVTIANILDKHLRGHIPDETVRFVFAENDHYILTKKLRISGNEVYLHTNLLQYVDERWVKSLAEGFSNAKLRDDATMMLIVESRGNCRIDPYPIPTLVFVDKIENGTILDYHRLNFLITHKGTPICTYDSRYPNAHIVL